MNPLASDYYTFDEELKSSSVIETLSNRSYRERRQILWHAQVPRLERFLYRYSSFHPDSTSSIEKAKDILHSCRLWLASPDDFNDPFDSKVHILQESDSTRRRQKISQLVKTFQPELTWKRRRIEVEKLMLRDTHSWQKQAEAAIRSEIRSVGVSCFTSDPKNLLMWSHYADSHKGICYQFEMAGDLNVLSRTIPVQYTNRYPDINFFTYKPQEIIDILLSKFDAWQYEKEIRLIAPQGARKYLQYSPKALKGVIIGSQMPASAIDILCDTIKQRSKLGLPSISIYTAEQHTSDYRILIRKSAQKI